MNRVIAHAHYNSIRTAVLSGTTEHLDFLPALQVIIRKCNDAEAGASVCLEDGHDSSPEQLRLKVQSAGYHSWDPLSRKVGVVALKNGKLPTTWESGDRLLELHTTSECQGS